MCPSLPTLISQWCGGGRAAPTPHQKSLILYAALNSLIGPFTRSGNKIDQLLVNLVANDGFRFVAPM